MNTMVRTAIAASFAIVFFGGAAIAQAPSAEARLKSLNITLPPDSVPIANFVNSVATGKLLFLSGNTGGAEWAGKGSSAAS